MGTRFTVMHMNVSQSSTKKVKGTFLNGTPMTELRDVTCHMGLHSVTCYPTQVNARPSSAAELSRYRSTVICLQSCRSCTAFRRGLSSDLCCLSCTLPISAESSRSTVFHCTSTLTTVKSIFHRQSTTRQPRWTDSLIVLNTWMLAERWPAGYV